MQSAKLFNLFALLRHSIFNVDRLGQFFPLVLGNIQTRFIFFLQLGPSHRFWISAQNNIGTTSRHVGRNGHRTQTTGLSNNLSFTFMVLSVKDLMGNAASIKQLGKQFTFLNRGCSDQHRSTAILHRLNLILGKRSDRAISLQGDGNFRIIVFLNRSHDSFAIFQVDSIPLVVRLDLVRHGSPFEFLGRIDHVRVRNPQHRTVGGNRNHVQPIDLPKLARFGHRGTGHPGEFVVKLKVVLKRDRRQSLSFLFDLYVFFGLDRLMQTVTPLATFHQSTGKLIDDDNPAIFNHVVHVDLVQVMRL